MEQYIFDSEKTVFFSENTDIPLLSRFLSRYTGNSEIKSGKNADNCIYSGKTEKPETDDAEFVLVIEKDGFFIRGKDTKSLVRGFMTFLEKIRTPEKGVYSAQCGIFYGKPALSVRAVHLCVFPETKFSFLEKCVYTCAVARYTHVILEFWGMLKYDCMPELAWDFAYSKEMARNLCKAINALGMEVIPMFNHLGHASACREVNGKHVVLDQNIEYEYMFSDNGWVWNFENREVYDLLCKVRAELMEVCGDGKYFHLGCDEAYSLGKGKQSGIAVSRYINSVQKELEKDGRRAIIWGDMLLDKKEFSADDGYSANSDKETADTICENLDKNIVIADWQYNVFDGVWKSSQKLKMTGFDILCCPWGKTSNCESAVVTARQEELCGIIHTTWHTLHGNFHIMLFSGNTAYEGTRSHVSDQELAHHAAAIVRKVYPSSEYENTGWSERMTGPGL